MKHLFAIILMMVMAVILPTQLCAREKGFDKNAKTAESKALELSFRQYDCNVSFTILIDSETSRQDVYLKFSLFSKNAGIIDVNGNLLAGCKGDPKYEWENHHIQKSRTDNYYNLRVWYPVEDTEGLFECNKLRLQTVTGNIDIELSRSEVKELQRNYEKAVAEATVIYKTNTDITFGF